MPSNYERVVGEADVVLKGANGDYSPWRYGLVDDEDGSVLVPRPPPHASRRERQLTAMIAVRTKAMPVNSATPN
jgi:hypothetical protein